MEQADNPRDLDAVVRFHGHLCPGLALGFRAAETAMAALAAHRAEDEQLIAIVENDSCSADAVQYVTGCTFGKGNFFFRDYGKQVLTLALRASGQAVRIALRAQRRGEPAGADRQARINWLLHAPAEDLFEVMMTTIALPEAARVQESVLCDGCGEVVMSTRATARDGRTLCIPCAQEQAG